MWGISDDSIYISIERGKKGKNAWEGRGSKLIFQRVKIFIP